MVSSHGLTASVAFTGWARGYNAATHGVGTINHQRWFSGLTCLSQLVVGGWYLVVGGQHLAAPLRITQSVLGNRVATRCDAVPNHQPLTTNHVFQV